jgi:predicted RNA-binding Zn ribbon-like protein
MMSRVVTLAQNNDDDEDRAAAQPLFVDFVNTLHWYEGLPIELIGTPADLAHWLAEYALPAVAPATGLPALLALRAHARAATEAIASGQVPAAADLAALNTALGAPRGRLVLRDADTPRAQLAFAVEGDEHAVPAFQIALSFANFLESGQRQRLKLCANPGCGFAFVDTSTNGTRRWCFMRYCGNRLKLRAFRQRRATAELSEGPGGKLR